MATTFTTVTEWMLDLLDPNIERGGKFPQGAPYAAPTLYEWIRDTYTVYLHRDGVGLQSFAPRLGELTQGDAITWTGGGDTLFAGSTFTYTCTDNPLRPREPGIWRELIVWHWESEWREARSSEEQWLYEEEE